MDTDSWMLFWTAIGSIGSIIGAVLTPIAIFIAFKEYRVQLKKSLVVFHSAFEYNKAIYKEDIEITIYNSGIRKIIVTGIGLETPTGLGYRGSPPREDISHLCPYLKFPVELNQEDYITLTLPIVSLLEWTTRNLLSSELDSDRYKIYIRDASRKFYYDKEDIWYKRDDKIINPHLHSGATNPYFTL